MAFKGPADVAVFGSGSWATALARLMATNGHRVHWWVRLPEEAEAIARTGRNPNYLSEAEMPLARLRVSAHLAEAAEASDVLLFVIPAAYLHASIAGLGAEVFAQKQIASAIKGFEVNTGLIISDYFRQQHGVAPERYATIMGPSHAEEVVQGRTTFLTVGSASEALASRLAGLLRNEELLTIESEDVWGMELAAVLKNIYAIGVGIALGLGYGDNVVSVFVANCLREMHGMVMFADYWRERAIEHSPYLGDLLVTAYSPHSRNRQLGRLVGGGLRPEEALAQMRMVAEGYMASKLLKKNMTTWERTVRRYPIAHAVHDILHDGAAPGPAFRGLLAHFR